MSQQYPQSNDKKIQLLTDILISYAYQQEVEFSIEGQELYNQEVFGHFGCLSLLLIDAKENYEKIYNQNYSVNDLIAGYQREGKVKQEDLNKLGFSINEEKIHKQFPVIFIDNEDAYFNVEPVIESDLPFSILALFSHHALEEFILKYKKNPTLLVNGKIPLDSLYEKWKEKVLSNNIVIKPSSTKVNINK